MMLIINAVASAFEVNEKGNTVVQFKALADNDAVLSYPQADGTVKEYPVKQIASNTEGKVLSALITLEIEGSEPPVKPEQVVQFMASFTHAVN